MAEVKTRKEYREEQERAAREAKSAINSDNPLSGIMRRRPVNRRGTILSWLSPRCII
ncbi:hypothetical protein [Lacticaseibacillus saniviri]|uniref:hypothetical protein n=1 Tax=Lacticaseibacillus saniviri TaxID=931533 RepID=UPI000AD44680|nr:hypothetical protein [Lacticaseibacillus saniviri]